MNTVKTQRKLRTLKTRLLSMLTLGHGINDFYSVLLPVLLPAIALDFDLSYTQFGFVLLITTLSSGFLQPLFGYLADKYGIQKPIIVVGFAMFITGLAGYSIASSFMIIVAFSFVYGLGETTFHAQSTGYLTEAFAANKGKAMGIHGLGGSIGNFLAPIVAALLITLYDWRLASLLLTIPAILIIGIFWGNLKNRKVKAPTSFISGLTPAVAILGINFGLIVMFHKGFLAFFPTWLLEKGETLTSAGAITSLMLVIGIVAQPFGGMLFDRFGGRVVFILSPILASVALAMLTSVEGVLVIPMTILIGMATTMTFPVALAMASSIASDGNAGMSVGLVFGIGSTMASFTPLITGFLADQFGLNSAFQLLIALPVLMIVMSLVMLPRHTSS